MTAIGNGRCLASSVSREVCRFGRGWRRKCPAADYTHAKEIDVLALSMKRDGVIRLHIPDGCRQSVVDVAIGDTRRSTIRVGIDAPPEIRVSRTQLARKGHER